MRAKLLAIVDALRSSYWFLPTVMAVLALVTARVLIEVDEWWVRQELSFLPDRLLAFDVAGARALLTTVAGSMITVAGVVFSVTMVSMTLASQQFGPRVLGAFMRDRGNQVVLGTFLATFLFCLASLPAVSRFEGEQTVPKLTLAVALLLTCGSLAVLIYFIHHAAVSIQVKTLIAEIQAELDRSLQAVLDQAEDWQTEHPAETPGREPTFVLPAARCGYVQRCDLAFLRSMACDHDLLVHVAVASGSYVADGEPLAFVYRDVAAGAAQEAQSSPEDSSEDERRDDEELAADLLGGFRLGWDRSLDQNVEFAVGQLVELAVRALSPGVNDPMTAIQCIDVLASSLLPLLDESWPQHIEDDDQQVRVVLPEGGFPHLLDAAFAPLRAHARDDLQVVLGMIDRLATLGARAWRDRDRDAIRSHLERLAALPPPEHHDRDLIDEGCRRVEAALERSDRQASTTADGDEAA